MYVVGNWKMYKTAREAAAFLEEFLPLVKDSSAHIYLAVSHTSIQTAAQYTKGTNVMIGAQNVGEEREGAFTGEVSAIMLKEAGAQFTLIGHSERRSLFNEDDEMIAAKVRRALQDDLRPIVCVEDESQLEALSEIPETEAVKIIVAYEPVSAIGTGKTPTAKQIHDAHVLCKKTLVKIFGKKTADLIPILYGGSVKAENAKEITAIAGVDGVLVGGASLNAQSFAKIISNSKETK